MQLYSAHAATFAKHPNKDIGLGIGAPVPKGPAAAKEGVMAGLVQDEPGHDGKEIGRAHV